MDGYASEGPGIGSRAMAEECAGLIPCARAKFEFQAKSDVELSFSAGVSVRLLRRIDDNWLEGELEGKVGIFPAAYVDIELGMPSKTRENQLAKSGRPYAIGLYEFRGDCEGDLSFAKGELIELLGPAGSGWMRGKTGRGDGIFPASFVEILKLPGSSERCSAASSSVYPATGEATPSRQSPEYALPLPMSPKEPGNTPDQEEDMVFENGFPEEGEAEEEGEGEGETQPVPTPYRKSKASGVQDEGWEREIPSQTVPVRPLQPEVSPPLQRHVSNDLLVDNCLV